MKKRLEDLERAASMPVSRISTSSQKANPVHKQSGQGYMTGPDETRLQLVTEFSPDQDTTSAEDDNSLSNHNLYLHGSLMHFSNYHAIFHALEPFSVQLNSKSQPYHTQLTSVEDLSASFTTPSAVPCKSSTRKESNDIVPLFDIEHADFPLTDVDQLHEGNSLVC
jgi:hypothetical protein